MKKSIILLFIAPIISFSQINIKGKIVDDKGEAIEYVNVALKDSIKVISSSTTDSKGNFILKVPKSQGKYIVETHTFGYKSEKRDIELKDKDIELGQLRLTKEVELLNEMELSTKVPVIENLGDKLVVNVSDNPFAKGRMTSQLLNNVPFMTANRNEGITLLGGTPLILVNDRRLFMSSEELLNFLQSIPAEDIRSIEIYTNPPARFDAEGVSGVINININKSALMGLKGNVITMSGTGYRNGNNFSRSDYYRTYGGMLSLDYRDERWYFRVFTGINKVRTPNLSEDKVNFLDNNEGFTTDRNYIANFDGKGINAEIGRDITEDQNIVFNYSYGNFINDDDYNYENRIYDSVKSQTNMTRGYVDVYNYTKRRNLGFNYNWDIDKKGHNLTFIADYYNTSRGEDQDISNKYYTPPNFDILNREWKGYLEVPTVGEIYSTQIDYNLPTEIGEFSLGGKFTYSKMDNRTDYYVVDLYNGDRVRDDNQSIDFIYTEGIYALYAGYSFGGLKLGLRYEYTDALYKDRKIDNKLDRSYQGFFPSISYTHQLFEKRDAITLSYNMRLQRPGYGDFNRFSYDSDNQTSVGYSNIRPSFPNRIQLTYNLMKRYSFIGEFSYTSNTLTRVTYATSNNSIVSQRRNIDDLYVYRLSSNVNQPILEWWNLNFSASMNYNIMKGSFSNTKGDIINIDNGGISSNLQMSNMFSVLGYNITLIAKYSPENRFGFTKYYDRGNIDISVDKNFLDNKLMLGLDMMDVFLTNRSKNEMNIYSIDKYFYKYPIGMIFLYITYRFEAGRKDTKEMKIKKSIEEEEGRM